MFPQEDYTDKVVNALTEVAQNTDAFHGWSIWITVITFIAAIATIVTTYTLIIEIRRRRTSKNCQARIITDLIRHFFINNAISEAIRELLEAADSRKETFLLREGVLSRYCVLDSDIELNRLSASAQNYDNLHELQFLLRNYNITCHVAEKHFTQAEYSNKEKLADLDEIWERSKRLTERFIDFDKISNLKVSTKSITQYIRHHYTNIENDSCEETGCAIPERPANSVRACFDNAPFNLTDIFNEQVLKRKSYVKKNLKVL